jgi:hypothetical protein
MICIDEVCDKNVAIHITTRVFLHTVHGSDLPPSLGHMGACPLLTERRRGHERPAILFLTGKGLSVSPSFLKLDGKLLFMNTASWISGW